MSSPETDSLPRAVAALSCWEVTAGLLPGKDPDPQYTKQFWITAEDRDSPDAPTLWFDKREAAYEYARLLTDPRTLNWVRVDWVWF